MSKYIITDYRTEQQAIENLLLYADKIITTNSLDVHKSINGHPDIGVCKTGSSELVVCPSQYEYFKSELPGIEIISGSSEPCGKYPDDVFYNAACHKDVAIHNFAYTDKITLAVIEQKFSKRINVRQGYSKCSVCFTNNNGIITEDAGIFKTLKNYGFDVLKISEGKIKLNGMNYGFFGGSTGLFNDKLFINGELKTHPDRKEIAEFLIKHDTEPIEINTGEITDIGSIIFVESKN